MPVIKNCRLCKFSFSVRPSHAPKKFYCSKKCMSEDYKIRLSGKNNPNYRNTATKKCINCNELYNSYEHDRKYCSHKCYTKSAQYKNNQIKASRLGVIEIKKRPKKGKKVKIKPYQYLLKVTKKQIKPNHICLHCSKKFHSYQKKAQYCSYDCSYSSGSSWRAGIQAAKMRVKYGAKKDANHNEIVNALLKAGIPFYDLSSVGGGVPDGIVWINESWQFIEIKNLKTAYGKRGLNKNQKKWISQWKGGPVYLLHNIDEVILLIKGQLSKLKSFSSDNIDIMRKM